MRDVLFVDDLVRAMLIARDRIGELAGQAFNVGGGPENTVSLLELIELIGDLHGARPEFRPAEERLGDQRWYVSNTAKLRIATGWTPRVGVAEGVEALYRRLAPLEAASA
jgi:CDP-paratose 2-epimerase